MLTARGRAEDVLRGFESGADDYLPKPFELAILHRAPQRAAAAQAVERAGDAVRRQQRQPSIRDVCVCRPHARFRRHEVHAAGKSYRLTLMECELLRYLVKNAGQPVSRRAILEDVWGLDEGTDTRAIDNFIVRLRRYIEDRPASPKFLQTVRGVGYRFVPDVPEGLGAQGSGLRAVSGFRPDAWGQQPWGLSPGAWSGLAIARLSSKVGGNAWH